METETRASILVALVSSQAMFLMSLSSRRCRCGNPLLRFVLRGVSTAYFPLMAYVLSYLTTSLISVNVFLDELLLMMIVLVQFLKAKADMAALAVGAIVSPVAGDSLKIRPSLENLIYSFWVAVLVIYRLFIKAYQKASSSDHKFGLFYLRHVLLMVSLLWVLGACRMVLRFTVFQRATRSFALGRRNAQLIAGYMLHLIQQEDGRPFQAVGQEGHLPGSVPRLIVAGERNQDVEENPLGYRIKRSALEDRGRRLVTLDQIWSESDPLLISEHKDLCLSFALFKCLRRHLAGYRLAEAGSSWAFHFLFVMGLLGQEDDHERIFRVITNELSFATDFYYSLLPVVSLGVVPAALHIFLSFLISTLISFLIPLLLLSFSGLVNGISPKQSVPLATLAAFLAGFNVCAEIKEMLAGVRSNWTKISIIGHYIRFRSYRTRRIFSFLLRLRCKRAKHWNGKIGQVELLKPIQEQSLAHLFKQVFLPWQNRQSYLMIKVPPEVKAALLASFRSCGGQLSDGKATLHRWCSHDLSWACHGDEVTTTTDVLLVWHIATSLFEIRYLSASSSACTASMVIAQSLSRYCTYLVAEAPDLLLDDSAWTKCRYKAVKKHIEKASMSSHDMPESQVYGHLIDSFGGESSHEVMKKGSRLAKQLVEEAAGAGGEDAVWGHLAEFWSEMVLYLAPSDNVKVHIKALQHGGELITLLWALLLHAGITSRPARHVPEP